MKGSLTRALKNYKSKHSPYNKSSLIFIKFTDTIRSQKAMQKVLSGFNLLRNTIAHSGELNDDEIMRF